MKQDIENRNDVYTLVSEFYTKIRVDPELGPIFNTIIKDWDFHLKHLTDFWETNLFAIAKYKGDPIGQHQKADQQVQHKITQQHFGRWLNLWFATIDDLFDGEKAETAKRRAQKMSTFLFIKIFEARSNYSKN